MDLNLKNIHYIFFVGIGGIGMSALAKYFLEKGKRIAGYDRTPSSITKGFQKQGISISFIDEMDSIDQDFLDPKATLIVYTPAISKNSKILNFFLNHGFEMIKRSQILGRITKNTKCYAIAGTHGKTTTSSILGHIMQICGVKATSFLGGISENYNSNLILGGDEISIVEADEFDRSFLELSPNVACITSMDADHLDIYQNKKNLEISFREFAKKVSNTLIVKHGLAIDGMTYSVEGKADYEVHRIKINPPSVLFDVKTPFGHVENVFFQLPGKHNISNALAAIAMAQMEGLTLENIKMALASYRGVKRRFSYKINNENLILIDDYAHHPSEIFEVEKTLREMYPNEKITVIFQPHLFTRTRDFMSNFAESLSKFDEIILLEIYPAREEPIEGVDSKRMLNEIQNENKSLEIKENILNRIRNTKSKVVAMLGAGDIDSLIEKVTKILNPKK